MQLESTDIKVFVETGCNSIYPEYKPVNQIL